MSYVTAQGRGGPTYLPLPLKGKQMNFCFLDENGEMQVDVLEALGMFEIAAQQLLDNDIGEEELPFFLFLCGAEAILRTTKERVVVH